MFAEMAYKGKMEKPTQHTSPGKEVRSEDLSLYQESVRPRPSPIIPWEESVEYVSKIHCYDICM